MNTMKKMLHAVDRYLDMLARERVYFFQMPPGRDPWCLSAVPTLRSAVLEQSTDHGNRTTTVHSDCTVTEQSAATEEVAELMLAKSAPASSPTIVDPDESEHDGEPRRTAA